jgi:SAM-dependent methyltransferase
MTNNFNSYLSLCTEVYELSKPHPPQDAYQFYQSYAKEAKGAILEPMCGTGRFLLPMLDEGLEVHGFDASEHMLAALNSKAEKQGLKPYVWQGFIEGLAADTKYKMIFIPTGSFCLISDLATALCALKILYHHLADGGVLLFEVETPNSLPPLGVWRGSKWNKEDGKMIILSQCANYQNNVCSSIAKYELVAGNKIIHTEIEEYKIRIYDQDEIFTLLKEAGFNRIHAVKAFDRNSVPAQGDESIVYEARK